MIRTFFVGLGLVAAAGAPALYAATRPAAPASQGPGSVAPTTTAAQPETIICPLTGEEIEPCCCPLEGEETGPR